MPAAKPSLPFMNRRAILLVAGLAATFPAFALDYETPGETLGALFPKLAKESGMTLYINADVANEVVVLRAKNVDATTLLKKIGEATGLSWSQDSGGYRLARTFQDDQKSGQELYQFTLNGWKNWQPDPARNNVVDSVVAAIQPEMLANIGIGTRVVYADRNNRNQLTLPTESRTRAAKLVAEDLQRRIDAMEAAYKARPSDQLRQIIDSQKTPPAKIILVMRRNSLNTYSATLQALDSNGSARFSYSSGYAIDSGAKSAEALTGWKLGEDAPVRQMLQLTTGTAASSDPSIYAPLRKSLLDPFNNEPIALAIGPALLASAPPNQNFVACIPDESFDRVSTALQFQGPAGLNGTGVSASKSDDGWVVVSPELKSYTWDTRRDRKALGVLANKLARAGILSIADQADYARTVSTWFTGNSWEYGFARRTLGASAVREFGRISGSQIEGLAIYNALREKLIGKSQVLPITDLQRNFITFTVFNSPADPNPAPASNSRGNTGQAVAGGVPVIQVNGQAVPQPPNRGGQQFQQFTQPRERTEMYAAGLPTGGQIEVTANVRPVYIVRSQDGTAQSTMAEGELAYFRASQLSTNVRYPNGGISLTNNVFGLTTTETYTFTIRFADGTSFSRTVSGTQEATSFATYDRLPSDVTGRIEKQAQEIATRANDGQQQGRGQRGPGRQGGRGGGGTPPPSRP